MTPRGDTRPRESPRDPRPQAFLPTDSPGSLLAQQQHLAAVSLRLSGRNGLERAARVREVSETPPRRSAERRAPMKFVPSAAPSVPTATAPGNMAAASSPSVFMVAVNGQIESGQVSGGAGRDSER